MSEIQQQLFDYSSISNDCASQLKAIAVEIKVHEEAVIRGYLAIASKVAAARELMDTQAKQNSDGKSGYDLWLEWGEKELGYKYRMMQSLNQIHNNLAQHAAPNLPKSQRALLSLAQLLESAPDREEALEEYNKKAEEKGESLTEKEIKRLREEIQQLNADKTDLSKKHQAIQTTLLDLQSEVNAKADEKALALLAEKKAKLEQELKKKFKQEFEQELFKFQEEHRQALLKINSDLTEKANLLNNTKAELERVNQQQIDIKAELDKARAEEIRKATKEAEERRRELQLEADKLEIKAAKYKESIANTEEKLKQLNYQRDRADKFKDSMMRLGASVNDVISRFLDAIGFAESEEERKIAKDSLQKVFLSTKSYFEPEENNVKVIDPNQIEVIN